MLLNERVKDHFSNSIQAMILSADSLSTPIAQAGNLIVQTLLNGGKIFTCGNDGAAANAQYLSAKLLNHYEMERPSLPAVSLSSNVTTLTAIANGYNYQDIFSKQIYALTSEADILITFSTENNPRSIIEAVQVAHEKGSKVISITGGNHSGSIQALLTHSDVLISVPSEKAAHVHECHTLIVHILCDLIDQKLFGSETF